VAALGGGTLLLEQRHQAEQAREQARRQQAAESALAQAGDLQRQGRWAEALAVLEQVRQRLDERDGEVCRAVQRAVDELELVKRLEKVRLRAATGAGRSFARGTADREYEAEFRAAGLGGPDEPADAVAERVRASGVRAALVAALDAWAGITEDLRRCEWALAVARSADPDDAWGRRLRASWSDPAALEELAREAPLDRLSPHLLKTLADALVGSHREALPFLRKAQLQYPGDFWLTLFLAMRLHEEGQLPEAAGFYRAALAARPDTPAVLVNLGVVLQAQRKLDDASACYRRAIELDPKIAMAHYNLGNALRARGELDEAIICYRKAVESDAKDPKAHYNLGLALKARGKVDEAIECYRKAIALDPRDLDACIALGLALKAQKKVNEAIECYHKALEFAPRDARLHTNLGNALAAEKKLDEAIECYHRALELDPTSAGAHYNLGNALDAKGQFDAAIACFRKAIEIDGNYAEAYCNLGDALKSRGDFAEALEALRRGHELGSMRADWKYESDKWVLECERLVEREKELLSVFGGSSEPADARERIEWAGLCVQTRRYVAAARLSGEAFAAEAKLANDLEAGHRYRAATAAALAGVGQGRDAGKLTDEARTTLRTQALDWLKADLVAWRSHKEGSQRAQVLRKWRADKALAGVRDEEWLAKLPPAERAAWRGLWTEVEKLSAATVP
jgi:tetratricopeptide (TPR) repeat protein